MGGDIEETTRQVTGMVEEIWLLPGVLLVSYSATVGIYPCNLSTLSQVTKDIENHSFDLLWAFNCREVVAFTKFLFHV